MQGLVGGGGAFAAGGEGVQANFPDPSPGVGGAPVMGAPDGPAGAQSFSQVQQFGVSSRLAATNPMPLAEAQSWELIRRYPSPEGGLVSQRERDIQRCPEPGLRKNDAPKCKMQNENVSAP